MRMKPCGHQNAKELPSETGRRGGASPRDEDYGAPRQLPLGTPALWRRGYENSFFVVMEKVQSRSISALLSEKKEIWSGGIPPVRPCSNDSSGKHP